jgi:hypothetical protein
MIVTSQLTLSPGAQFMTIEAWLTSAVEDADRRGLPAMRALLEALARSTAVLRAADWNAVASDDDAATHPE